MEDGGITYGCTRESDQPFYVDAYHEYTSQWLTVPNGSPPESFSLFSFWLGRDSDALLEWPPEPKAKDWDHSFLYAG